MEARVKGEPGVVDRDAVDFIDVSPQQFISVATSLIPFLRNDDANRALMGSNMQRQAVPLVKPQAPLVGTGYEVRVAKDSGLAVVAQEDGVVQEVDARHIKVKSKTDYHDYQLKNFVRTNQYTCFHQKPIVEKGEGRKMPDVIFTFLYSHPQIKKSFQKKKHLM